MKTPLPGVVWCNCPHMAGIDGLKVEDLTRAEIVGRQHIHALVDFVRGKLPGFEHCFVVDVAPQTGVRQTRLLDGEYVMTKEDVVQRVRFDDSIARGRDYYYPFRALLPRRIDNLLVAGRHYSATSQAQKISREIPVHGDGRSRRHGRRAGAERGRDRARYRRARLAENAARRGRRSRRPDRPNADVPALAAYVRQAETA